jgi:hypothetical protein
MNKVRGATTNSNGYFEIDVQVDTCTLPALVFNPCGTRDK